MRDVCYTRGACADRFFIKAWKIFGKRRKKIREAQEEQTAFIKRKKCKHFCQFRHLLSKSQKLKNVIMGGG